MEHDTIRETITTASFWCAMGNHKQKIFRGLQLLVKTHLDDKDVVLLCPKNPADYAANQLDFKYYQDIARNFRLPPEAHLISAQSRIFGRGASEPRVRMNVTLSQG
ncbi:MAG: hypothetical protein WB870_12100 [Gallionellaceae bacterium]